MFKKKRGRPTNRSKEIKRNLKITGALLVVAALMFAVFSFGNITEAGNLKGSVSETNTITLTKQSRDLSKDSTSFELFIFNVKSTGGQITGMAYSKDNKKWYRFQDKYKNLKYSKDKTEVEVTIRKSYEPLYVRVRNKKGEKILKFNKIERLPQVSIHYSGDISRDYEKCFKNQLKYIMRSRGGIHAISYSTDGGKTYVDSSKFKDGIQTTIAKDQKTAEIVITKSFSKLKIKATDNLNLNIGNFNFEGYVNKDSNCNEPKQTMVITEDNYFSYKKSDGIYKYTVEDKSGATIKEMYWYNVSKGTWNKSPVFKPAKKYSDVCKIDECWHKFINSDGVEKIYNIRTKNNGVTKIIRLYNKIDLAKATIDPIAKQTYTGSKIKPKVVVKYDGKTKTEGKDYVVTYSNNVNPGTATVTVKGIGWYTGTKNQTFVIEKTGTQTNTPTTPKQDSKTNTPTTPKKNDTKTQNKVVKTNKIKLIGLTANQCKNPPINYSIDAAADNSGNIAKVEYSIDNGKTFNKSTKCSINGKKASCSITGRYKSIIYRVTTTGNHYQVFGKYCSQK